MLGIRSYYIRDLGYGITAPSFSHSSRADIHATCDARLTEVQRQAIEHRQQAHKLAARIDEHQQLQIQMIERMTQMERMIQLIR